MVPSPYLEQGKSKFLARTGKLYRLEAAAGPSSGHYGTILGYPPPPPPHRIQFPVLGPLHHPTRYSSETMHIAYTTPPPLDIRTRSNAPAYLLYLFYAGINMVFTFHFLEVTFYSVCPMVSRLTIWESSQPAGLYCFHFGIAGSVSLSLYNTVGAGP